VDIRKHQRRKETTLVKILTLIPLITLVLFTPPAAAKDHKPESGNIYGEQHREVGHWRENKSTKEIIIYDDLYREKYRINTESGRVFDKQHREVGAVDLKGEE